MAKQRDRLAVAFVLAQIILVIYGVGRGLYEIYSRAHR